MMLSDAELRRKSIKYFLLDLARSTADILDRIGVCVLILLPAVLLVFSVGLLIVFAGPESSNKGETIQSWFNSELVPILGGIVIGFALRGMNTTIEPYLSKLLRKEYDEIEKREEGKWLKDDTDNDDTQQKGLRELFIEALKEIKEVDGIQNNK